MGLRLLWERLRLLRDRFATAVGQVLVMSKYEKSNPLAHFADFE